MTKFLYESEYINENGHKCLNYIKITSKTIKQYFKFSGSENLVCVGNHYLLPLFFNNVDDLKESLIGHYQEISKEYILNY